MKGITVTLLCLPSGRLIAYGKDAVHVWRFRGSETADAPAIVEKASELLNFVQWATRQGGTVTVTEEPPHEMPNK